MAKVEQLILNEIRPAVPSALGAFAAKDVESRARLRAAAQNILGALKRLAEKPRTPDVLTWLRAATAVFAAVCGVTEIAAIAVVPGAHTDAFIAGAATAGMAADLRADGTWTREPVVSLVINFTHFDKLTPHDAFWGSECERKVFAYHASGGVLTGKQLFDHLKAQQPTPAPSQAPTFTGPKILVSELTPKTGVITVYIAVEPQH